MSTISKPPFLLDTSPLSVLCGFPTNGTPYIHTVMRYAVLILPDAVEKEIRGAGKMARIVSPLIKAGQIQSMATPNLPLIVDVAYGNGLGNGERAVIKCGLATNLPVIIDDQDAFLVACRFGLRPRGFQDFIVMLTLDYNMPKETAVEIVRVTARQFPAMYLAHTLDMLG